MNLINQSEIQMVNTNDKSVNILPCVDNDDCNNNKQLVVAGASDFNFSDFSAPPQMERFCDFLFI